MRTRGSPRTTSDHVARARLAVRSWWPVVLALTACLAFYVYLSVATGNLGEPAGPGVFNRLTEAFLHGRLSLDVTPPPGLLHLQNPYDPVQNEPFRHYPWEDLSLFHGRFYAYWGPAPAIVLFLPARLLGWHDFPEAVAALLFSVGALVMGAILLIQVVERWLPRVDRRLLGLAILALGTSNGVVFLLGSARVWQVASAAGVFFMLAALALLLRAAGGDRLAPVAAASLCLGLGLASRWSLTPTCALWVVLFLWLRRAEPRRRQSGAALGVAMFGPLAACLLGLLIYNAVRFGSPLETGIRVQITTVNWHDHGVVQPGVLPVGLRYFVLFPFLIRPLFPYVWQNPTVVSPGTFEHVEPMVGLLWAAPILLALLATPFVLRGRPELRRLVGLTAATGLVLLVLVASIPATAMRYEADYATFLVGAALIVWLAAATVTGPTRIVRAAVVGVGGAACVAGAVISMALAMSAGNVFHASSLVRFRSLETFFRPVPELASQIAGRPLLAAVDSFPILPRRLPGDAPTDTFGVERTLKVQVISGSAGASCCLVARLDSVGGASLVRVRSPDGSFSDAPADGRVHAIPMRLGRGLNQLVVTRVAVGAQSRPAYVLLDHLKVAG